MNAGVNLSKNHFLRDVLPNVYPIKNLTMVISALKNIKFLTLSSSDYVLILWLEALMYVLRILLKFISPFYGFSFLYNCRMTGSRSSYNNIL